MGRLPVLFELWRFPVVVPLVFMAILFGAAAYTYATAGRCAGEVMAERDICLMDGEPNEQLVRASDESAGPYRGHTREEKRQTSMILAGAYVVVGCAAGGVAIRQYMVG